MARNAASLKKLRDKVKALEAQASINPSLAATSTRSTMLACLGQVLRVWLLGPCGAHALPVCHTHRRFGATMVGSFRGQMQSSSSALADIRRQMSTLQLPSEISAAMRVRPRGSWTQQQQQQPLQQQQQQQRPQQQQQQVQPHSGQVLQASAPTR